MDGQLIIENYYCVDRKTGCVGLGVSGGVAKFDNFTVRLQPDSAPIASVPGWDNDKPYEVVAHRGFSSIAPENTLAAVRLAIASGANACEFDVDACKDRNIVLMHDYTVDRTTNGSGKVAELSLAELKKLDAGSWKDSKYAGEPVPTIAETLKLLKGTSCVAFVEIKVEGITQLVLDEIRAANMIDQTVMISFRDNVVREIRALEPRLPCGWLSYKRLFGSHLEQANQIAQRAIQCNTKLVLKQA